MRESYLAGGRRTTISAERGAIRRLAENGFDLGRRVLVVTDDGVPSAYAESVAGQAKEARLCVIPHGESSKCFAVLENLLAELVRGGFDRHDCVLAVGGGVVGDLAGFAAATYMRGIDFYNVPTTLLAAVDSSVGGKTAIDFMGCKNIVGAFHQPRSVLIDPDVFGTLPDRQWRCGLAEAFKMALTCDRETFEMFEGFDSLDDAKAAVEEVVARAVRVKKAVVEADEREARLRKVLNFGHTLGHAIESAAGGKLLHGECVALGMLPMCAPDLRVRVEKVLDRLGLPTRCGFRAEELREALMHDKKSAGEKIDAVLSEEAGTYRLCPLAPEDLLGRYRATFEEEL